MKYPDNFPEAFRKGVEDLARMNRSHQEIIAGWQRILDDVELNKFWPRMERQIEQQHEAGVLLGPVTHWKKGFVKKVLLQLFAPEFGGGESFSDRSNRRSKEIPEKAVELARLLEKDSDLLVKFSYFLGKRDSRAGTTGFKSQITLAKELRLLAQCAKESPLERHPYEPANKGAASHTRQKAIAIREIFLVYTGRKQWDWIKAIIEIAEQKDIGNIRYRIEKSEKPATPK